MLAHKSSMVAAVKAFFIERYLRNEFSKLVVAEAFTVYVNAR